MNPVDIDKINLTFSQTKPQIQDLSNTKNDIYIYRILL